MLTKITSNYTKGADLLKQVSIAEGMVEKYGWQDKTVTPYSFAVKVTKILADCKDYYECTLGSRDYLISLFNGLVPILNSWEKYENTPKISVLIKSTGKVVKMLPEDVDMLKGLDVQIL